MDAAVKGAPGAPEEGELDRLFEAIYRAYHYDFRAYARASIRRRVRLALSSLGIAGVSTLRERILHDRALFRRLLPFLTIRVSDLFRDPSFWRALRAEVLPHLATYPFPRVWIAGCGAGEEAYSMAILLDEEGLLERTQIYATDIDEQSLEVARRGVYDIERIRSFSQNYFAAGGRASLADHYSTAYNRAAMAPRLRRRILFSDHSLATDAAFAEVQLICCRNVLIYFDRPLQRRALELFQDALCPRGFLGLGSHESLFLIERDACFETVNRKERIYRMRPRS